MTINFVGNYANGYVGEQADQVHLAREMEELGHSVQRVPQDIWKAYCDDQWEDSWEKNLPIKADINIITKWHHFNDKKYIEQLREKSGAPVFYWVWDYMLDAQLPNWHIEMASEADLYLTNEGGIKREYTKVGVSNLYYFPFDVADGDLARYQYNEKEFDVTFFGSWINQGDRQEWLREINKIHPITVFSWNPEEWPDEFKDTRIAVYGTDFNRMVAQSKICLGFNVEPNCWGYWSNRVGKILLAGSFLLYQYAPGMELFLEDGVEYFSSIDEANEKIEYFLKHKDERDQQAFRGQILGQQKFTSKQRVKELMILCERYIKTNGEGWNY